MVTTAKGVPLIYVKLVKALYGLIDAPKLSKVSIGYSFQSLELPDSKCQNVQMSECQIQGHKKVIRKRNVTAKNQLFLGPLINNVHIFLFISI